MVLVFSDGLSEAVDMQDEAVIDHIQKILLPLRDAPAQEVCSQLWNSVRSLGSAGEQQDDFTLVCVKCAR